MHFFWLTFENNALENQFQNYMVQKYWKLDGIFIWTSGLVIISYLGRTLLEGNNAPALPMVVNLLNAVVIIWIRRTRGVAGMLTWRAPLILCSRLLGYYGFAVVHSNLNWSFNADSKNRTVAFLRLLQAHHVLGSLFPALGFKLKFTHHFWTRVLETGVFLFVQARQVCSNILQDPNIHRALEIEKFLDSSLHNLLKMFYSLIGLPGIPRNDKQPCYHLAYYIHILWSFGAVSYLTWRLERCTRVFFLDSLGNERQSSGMAMEQTITPVHDIYNLVVFVGLCCLLWEFMAIILMNMEGSVFNALLAT